MCASVSIARSFFINLIVLNWNEERVVVVDKQFNNRYVKFKRTLVKTLNVYFNKNSDFFNCATWLKNQCLNIYFKN